MTRRLLAAAVAFAVTFGLSACTKPASTETTAAASPVADDTSSPAADDTSSPAADATGSPVADATGSPVADATGSPVAAADVTATPDTPGTAAATTPESTVGVAPAASAAASAKAYTDLGGVFGAGQIQQLAQLGAFDTIPAPAFKPNKPVLRREFVRWLYTANNALQTADAAKQVHPAAAAEAAYFTDLRSTDADFGPIQGMQDAGISVGFPDKSFKPDVPITREQALAVAAALNCSYSGVWSKAPNEAYAYLPPWKDKASVSKTYAPILAACGSAVDEIVGRAYGKIALIRPTAPVLRSEAALMLWKINNVTASQALAATAPSATASP
jgi:hypothetical protein